MLVCSVVLRPTRGALAASIVEGALALDRPSIGTVFATVVDAPANAIDRFDSFIGSRTVEPASAADALDAVSVHPATWLEEISASVAAQDAAIGAVTLWATWD